MFMKSKLIIGSVLLLGMLSVVLSCMHSPSKVNQTLEFTEYMINGAWHSFEPSKYKAQYVEKTFSWGQSQVPAHVYYFDIDAGTMFTLGDFSPILEVNKLGSNLFELKGFKGSYQDSTGTIILVPQMIYSVYVTFLTRDTITIAYSDNLEVTYNSDEIYYRYAGPDSAVKNSE